METKEKVPMTGAAATNVAAPAHTADVLNVDKKKKKKRKYSASLRGVQTIQRGTSKALWRLTSAAESGVERWRDATEKSSRKKRDGALRDAVENGAKAFGKTLRVMSVVPLDLSKMVRRLKIRKTLSAFLPV